MVGALGVAPEVECCRAIIQRGEKVHQSAAATTKQMVVDDAKGRVGYGRRSLEVNVAAGPGIIGDVHAVVFNCNR